LGIANSKLLEDSTHFSGESQESGLNLGVTDNSMRFLCYTFFLFGLLVSCRDKAASSNRPLNDTAQIIEIALQEGTSVKYMPSVSPLFTKYKFGDSILLTSSVLPLDFLPSKASDHVFKIMSQQEICSNIKGDSSLAVPNYLVLSRVVKGDSGYYIQVQSLSCRPYGSGGSLGLYFRKVKDCFIVVDRKSWSIN
jgi:hypothetical protein